MHYGRLLLQLHRSEQWQHSFLGLVLWAVHRQLCHDEE
jgi:hypothetical protein